MPKALLDSTRTSTTSTGPSGTSRRRTSRPVRRAQFAGVGLIMDFVEYGG
jgi:hypothetical protein